jgi:hypothetical protein
MEEGLIETVGEDRSSEVEIHRDPQVVDMHNLEAMVAVTLLSWQGLPD